MFVIWQHLPNALNMYVCMYIYIYLYIHFPFGHNVIYFVIFALFCGCVSLTRLTVSAGWRLLRFDKFMFWVKILSHIYPIFLICTVPFKFNLTSCILFCMIILYRDLLYYIVFYILYYLYVGGFHASDSLSLNPFVTSPGDLRDLGSPFWYEARRSPGLIAWDNYDVIK